MIGALQIAWRRCLNRALKLIRRFRSWIDVIKPGRYHLVVVEGSMPERLRPHTLYILTEESQAWIASMLCPCGCRETLEMNMLTDERPCWRYSVDSDGYPSLLPSVWRKIGCRSHFFLRRGRIEWTSDSGRG